MTEKDKKKVSIIIPVYNSEEYIERAIKSTLNQSYGNIEVIVVDDGSEDDTPNICERLAGGNKSVKYYSQNHLGVSAARNNGIRRATGEYVFFLDADDTIDGKTIELLVEQFDDKKLLCCGINRIQDGKKRRLERQKKYTRSDFIAKVLVDELQGYCWGYLFRKDCCPSFDERIGYCEDVIFLFDYVNDNQIETINFLSDGFYNYYVNNMSVTHSSSNIKNKLSNIDMAMDIIEKMVSEGQRQYVYEKKAALFETELLRESDVKIVRNIFESFSLKRYRGGRMRLQVFLHIFNRRNVFAFMIYRWIVNFLKALLVR